MKGHHHQQLLSVSLLSGRYGLEDKDIIPKKARQKDKLTADRKIYINIIR
jgi:hypothetical protein